MPVEALRKITEGHRPSQHRIARLPKISAKQDLAIVALLSGASDAEAAGRAGVSRETLNRWKNSRPAFAAELNRRRAMIWESQLEALRGLVPKAVRAIEEGLDAEDVRTKMRAAELVLKTVGIAAEPLAPPDARVAPHETEKVGALWSKQRRPRPLSPEWMAELDAQLVRDAERRLDERLAQSLAGP